MRPSPSVPLPLRWERAELLGVSKSRLRVWDATGTFPAVRTPGNCRRYRLSAIRQFQGLVDHEDSQTNAVAVYVRVSSHDQKPKGDLERQKGRVLQHCAEKGYRVAHILEEVGSGMNDNRAK